MFVVLDAIDAGNYNWWSRGGTITAGKKHSFRIEIDRKNIAENLGLSTDESKLVLEDGVLKGLKDPSLTRLVLPASVKSIAPGAFWESKIESLVLNEGLESIGLQAFAKSQKLTSVTFPSSLKRIGEHAFEDCTHLEEVNYVGQVTVAGGILESSAFEGCESLTKIILPQSISELQEGVFMECSKLKEIILPKYVRRIKDYGLRTNYKLDRIRFEGDEVPEIGNYSLPFLESITEIMVPKGKLSLYKAKYQDYQSIIIETP